MIEIKYKYIERLYAFSFSFLLFGFFLSASITSLLRLDTRILSVSYRGLATIFYLYLLIYVFKNGHTATRLTALLHIFFVFYAIRIVFDIEYYNISYASGYNASIDKTLIYSFLFFNIILPLYVNTVIRKNNHLSLIKKWMNIFIFICVFFVLLSVFIQNKYSDDVLKTRVTLGTSDANRLNPIKISILGSIGILASILNIFLNRVGIITLLLNIFLFASSLILLLLGASRGPFIGLLLSLCFFLTLFFKINKSSYYKVGTIFLFLLIILFSLNFISNYVGEVSLINRFFVFGEFDIDSDRSRSNLFEISLNQFINSPFFGSSFLTISDNPEFDRISSHNIILDSLISVGFFVSILLFLNIYKYIKIIFSLKKFDNEKIYFIIISIPFFVTSMVSGSIFLDVEFWCIFSFILSLEKKY